jgi:GTP1/Obg family GTP-binding protein
MWALSPAAKVSDPWQSEVVDQVEKVLKELVFVVNKTDALSERDVHTVIDIMTSGKPRNFRPMSSTTSCSMRKRTTSRRKPRDRLPTCNRQGK